MEGIAEISLYYLETARVKAGQPEKNLRLEKRVTATYESLDVLLEMVKNLAHRQHRASGKSVLAQTFVWIDGEKGSIHVAYEIDSEGGKHG